MGLVEDVVVDVEGPVLDGGIGTSRNDSRVEMRKADFIPEVMRPIRFFKGYRRRSRNYLARYVSKFSPQNKK